MFRRVNKGLTIIEVLIVLAVSAGLAVISIGAFSSRGRTQDDDAARQVLANIALVRNQAQQGQGPTTEAGKNALVAGSILYGQAIEFTNDGTRIDVKKLAQKTDGSIYVYETQELINPSQLAWNMSPGGAGIDCEKFTSCYFSSVSNGLETFINSNNAILDKINTSPEVKLVIVFLNGSGQSFALTSSSYLDKNNYTQAQQKNLRIGLAKVGKASPNDTSSPQYYVKFDLAIPNNQDLQVLK
jgi:prepilin-type N-terminal cleavage/methylation domain-containing protein